MARPFSGGWIAIALLVILPAFGASWFWVASFRDVQERFDAETVRNMEDVLNRVLHNSHPPMMARDILDRAIRLIHRGVSPDRALRDAQSRLKNACNLLLFDPAGNPIPIRGKPVAKVSANKRLFEAIGKMRRGKALTTSMEKKLSEQLLGDQSGIIVLAGSHGNFRRFGNQGLYSHGARWTIKDFRKGAKANSGKVRFHLLALLNSRYFKTLDITRDSVRKAAALCRRFFRLALVGNSGSKSFHRLPMDLRRGISLLPGEQGVLKTERYQAVVRFADAGWRVVAWRPRTPTHQPQRDFGQLFIFLLAGLLSGFIASILVFHGPESISLRWLVPGLLLGVTIPILLFFALAMEEHRRRLLDKDIYQSHRTIEAQLRQIDQNFLLFTQKIATRHRQDLERFCATHDPAALRGFSPDSGMKSLYSAYLFDEKAGITRILTAAPQNAIQDRKLAEEVVKKLIGLVFGKLVFSNFEDPYFAHYIVNLGWFVENKLLNSTRFQLLDIRTDPTRPDGLAGIFLTHSREPLVRGYFRQIFENRSEREDLLLAIVSYEEGNLVRSLPRTFLDWPDGARISEMVLRQGQTMDSVMNSPSGRPLLVTCLQGRNLSGYLLVGAVPFSRVAQAAAGVKTWTIATLALGIALALLSGYFLVNPILSRLEEIREGIDQIVAHRSEVKIACPAGDEFGELARGIEQAAITLEEVYSSLPVQEILVKCDPLNGPEFRFAGGFDPGTDPGGDYLDGFLVSNDRYLLAVGDVLGVGWQTTMLVASMRMAVRLQLQRHPELSVSELADLLKTHYLGIRSVVKHMAVFVGLLDIRKQNLEWVGAGICPPMLVRNGTITYLSIGNPPLGAAVNRPLKTFSEVIRPGDRLVLYTDGWIKTQNEQGVQFGFDRFSDLALRVEHEDPAVMIAAFRTGVTAAGFTKSVGDDRSVLCLTRAGSSPLSTVGESLIDSPSGDNREPLKIGTPK